MGASLESETTLATLGQAGVRAFQPMSNLDFVSIPLGRYVKNHLDFAADVKNPPLIFAANYYLKGKDGKYLNGMTDKHVWVKWMERRVHGEVRSAATPTGCIPLYDDLKRLFREVLDKEYTHDQYSAQFMLRIPENLSKLDRIERIWRTEVADTPEMLLTVLAEQRRRLEDVQRTLGDYVPPSEFAPA
jgi:phosphoenolpyruvate carboxykinase (GTP)